MPPRHGILHSYQGQTHSLNLFEFIPPTSTITDPFPKPQNVLLFIGGMYDNFGNPGYPTDLAALFPIHQSQTWRVMHVQLASNGRTFGILSIDRDIDEIAQCIRFIRSDLYRDQSINVVLMGHSTGCQDILHYLIAKNPVKPNRPARVPVQGAILQAAVSDRDQLMRDVKDGSETVKKAYERVLKLMRETPKEKWRDVLLPLDLVKGIGFGPVPMSVERMWSLCSPESPEKPTEEDLFSSDLGDQVNLERFGRVAKNGLLVKAKTSGKPEMMVLLGDSDETMSSDLDKVALLARWKNALEKDGKAKMSDHSTNILNALHAIDGEDWPSQEARLVVMRKCVLSYLEETIGNVPKEGWDIWSKDRQRVWNLKSGDGRKIEDAVGVLKL